MNLFDSNSSEKCIQQLSSLRSSTLNSSPSSCSKSYFFTSFSNVSPPPSRRSYSLPSSHASTFSLSSTSSSSSSSSSSFSLPSQPKSILFSSPNPTTSSSTLLSWTSDDIADVETLPFSSHTHSPPPCPTLSSTLSLTTSLSPTPIPIPSCVSPHNPPWLLPPFLHCMTPWSSTMVDEPGFWMTAPHDPVRSSGVDRFTSLPSFPTLTTELDIHGRSPELGVNSGCFPSTGGRSSTSSSSSILLPPPSPLLSSGSWIPPSDGVGTLLSPSPNPHPTQPEEEEEEEENHGKQGMDPPFPPTLTPALSIPSTTPLPPCSTRSPSTSVRPSWSLSSYEKQALDTDRTHPHVTFSPTAPVRRSWKEGDQGGPPVVSLSFPSSSTSSPFMPSLALPSSSSSSSSPLLLPSMAPAFWERPEEEEEEEENNPHPKMMKKKGLSPIFPICLEPDPLDWQAMEFIVHLPPKPPAPRVHRVSVNETKEKEKEIEEEDEDGSLSERTPDEGGGVRRFFPLLPPIDPSKTHTLVLDLDETLLHCSTCPMPSASITFSVELNHMHFDIYGNLRPYLAFFLATVAKVYEVVVFTASQAVYAQRVVQWVDPNHQFISHCLYRDSCVFINGTYLKDLSLLGRDLATTLIVDNTPQSFGYHLANGIPIRSWYNDPEDHQLVHLSHVLLHLATYPDVRWVVKEWSLVHRYVDQQRRDRHLGLSLSLKKES